MATLKQRRSRPYLSVRLSLILLLGLAILGWSSEKVCKFKSLKSAERLLNQKIQLPDGAVAMDNFVFVDDKLDSATSGTPTSIIFILDNSSTMRVGDPNGSRFTVTDSLIGFFFQKNPEMQVGLIVFGTYLLFYQPDDAKIFKQMETIEPAGAYIPLLTLGKTYPSKIGNVPGYQILQHYLKIHQTINGAEMDYISSWATLNSMNAKMTFITAGFEAGKLAMKESLFPKDHQFFIFYSDGISNVPDNDVELRDRYVKGEQTPTTFTVYFSTNDQTPQNLLTMTENIKKNNFSTSNPHSAIWSIKTSHDSLMSLLKKQVLPTIFSTITKCTPQKMAANSIAANGPWQVKTFPFERLFPLTGQQTPFTYVIDYKLTKDSIAPDGSVIQIQVKDTSRTILFTAAIGTNQPSDSVRLTSWGRSITFHGNGSQLSFLDNDTKDFEIRFAPFRVDTSYGYAEAEVTVTTTTAPTQDKEKFSLQKKGDYFSITVPHESAPATPGDGKLQHQNPDTITVTFRNPALPLDTLVVILPFRTGNYYELQSATYFDNTADGHIDSMFCAITGPKVIDHVAALVQAIQLPMQRNFELLKGSGYHDGIGLTLNERSPVIRTSVTDEDYVKIQDSVKLAENTFLLPSPTIKIRDSVAPVIMKALFYDSTKAGCKDRLSIHLSEECFQIRIEQPFVYYDVTTQKTYHARLTPLVRTVKRAISPYTDFTTEFFVTAVIGAPTIRAGDSIRINTETIDIVKDIIGNRQDNPLNIRRQIEVVLITEGIRISKGIYFDRTADGHIDAIQVLFHGQSQKIQENSQQLKELVVLPPRRQFSITRCTTIPGGISLDVIEQAPAIKTFVTADETIAIKKTVMLPDSTIVEQSHGPVIDSVAPVIMRADLFDTVSIQFQNGTMIKEKKTPSHLQVLISEPVYPTASHRPFVYFRPSPAARYNALLTVTSQLNETLQATVVSVDGVEGNDIRQGDSLWINWTQGMNIVDKPSGNNQLNENNVKRLIDFHVHTEFSYQVVLKATILDRETSYRIPPEMIDHPDLQAMLKNTLQTPDGAYRAIMFITLEPQPEEIGSQGVNLQARLTLLDALGNRVIDNKKMAPTTKNRLLYLWDGGNEQSRTVGRGAYKAIVTVDHYLQNSFVRTQTLTTMVGVKN
ncbi:MAG: VWA domain-containing protein [Chitinivibrionales bacterium]|nr:VWA domain-containing protein [Chitinivibrionales bacterium]